MLCNSPFDRAKSSANRESCIAVRRPGKVLSIKPFRRRRFDKTETPASALLGRVLQSSRNEPAGSRRNKDDEADPD